MNYFEKNYIKIMSILCYINFLVLIPFIREKRNKTILFHIKEGINLFILELISVYLLDLLNINNCLIILFYVVLSLIGIKNVIENNNKELPLIGKYKIIK